jgi:Tol biopolymer transport system component
MRLPAWVELQDISPDGKVLMVIGTPRGDIMALPPGEDEERNLSWHESSGLMDISADGKSLLFHEFSEGRSAGLYLRKTDGSPAIRLGEAEHVGGFSPDGRWTIVSKSPFRELQLLPTGAGEPQILSGHGIVYREAFWFPDGKRLLVSGKEENHLGRSYVQDLGGGKPRPLTPEGTFCWRVSPDGKQAACTDPSGKGMLYPLEGGDPSPIEGLEAGESIFRWSSDGLSLYVGAGGVPLKVFRLDLATGSRQLWREISPSDTTALMWGGLDAFSMTPDGKSYAYSTTRYPTDLYLVDGLQ